MPFHPKDGDLYASLLEYRILKVIIGRPKSIEIY